MYMSARAASNNLMRCRWSIGRKRMNWEQLKGQLEDAVKHEAVKVLDEAIARLQQLRAHYMD